MKRGTIHSYDSRQRTGIIIPDDTGPQISFVYPQTKLLQLFEPGDLVEFEMAEDQAIHVQIYQPIDILKDIYRCPRCRSYRRFSEVEQRIEEGDWGEGIEIFCKKCGVRIGGSGRFLDALSQYENRKMSEQDALEFAKALEDRSLLPDLLERLFKFH